MQDEEANFLRSLLQQIYLSHDTISWFGLVFETTSNW